MTRHYDEFAWHFRRLARAYKDGQIVFVLGAGVSTDYGQPNWAALLADLLLRSGRVPRLGRNRPYGQPRATNRRAELVEHAAITEILARVAPDPLLQGAIAKVAYPALRWRHAINGELGLDTERLVPPSEKDDPGVLWTIAEMLVKSIQRDPKRHISVLSFNYDLLLDRAVERTLRDLHMRRSLVQTIDKGDDFERTWLDAGIYIYHLHGHLADELPEPILDADSYVPVLRGDHWSWRCMERALASTGTSSLFIGLSLTDPSLRYVLTRWKSWQTPMTGVYLAPPPRLPSISGCRDQRSVALMYRSVMDLYSSVLDRLHLVCYYLSSYKEIGPILRFIRGHNDH